MPTPRRRASWPSKPGSPRRTGPAERTRDAIANYNPKSRAEVKAFAPGLDWQAMFDAMEIGRWDRFNANTPTALKGIAALVASQPLDDWKAYLTYHHVHNHAPYLPKAIDDENFAFYGKTLAGREQQRERWERGVDLVNRGLGEAIGQVYVKQHFPPESKAKIDALVANLIAAYKANIETLAWMGPDTRAKALEKLATLRVKIGYPDKWKDYSSMTIVPGDLLANARAAGPVGVALRRRQAGQARGQGRVADDAADGQRLLLPEHQRDHLPGRHPAAAVLRSERRRRRELRRHRRRDRPRDRPRLRRPGAALRRHRHAQGLVDQGRRRRVHRRGRRGWWRSTARSRRCPGSR